MNIRNYIILGLAASVILLAKSWLSNRDARVTAEATLDVARSRYDSISMKLARISDEAERERQTYERERQASIERDRLAQQRERSWERALDSSNADLNASVDSLVAIREHMSDSVASRVDTLIVALSRVRDASDSLVASLRVRVDELTLQLALSDSSQASLARQFVATEQLLETEMDLRRRIERIAYPPWHVKIRRDVPAKLFWAGVGALAVKLAG